jgi:signal transduction histidine kinase/HAMP domain-containing protein
MKTFRNLSLGGKQMLIIMATAGVALLMACAAFAGYEVITFREAMVRSLSTLAEIVGDNTSAALDFNDAGSAKETLSALRAEPEIVAACIYTKNGGVFTTYERANGNPPFTPPKLQLEGQFFGLQYLTLFRPIVHKGELIGAVYLEADMHALYSRLTRYAGLAGLVFLVALLIAFVLSYRLQSLISDPILSLAQMTRSVALEKNYSARAAKQSEDELGQLVDGFNQMLAQIQERDAALQTARDQLEKRVEERTAELRDENAERKHAEEALRVSQSLYLSLVEQLPVGVFRRDREGRYVFVNASFCRLRGGTPEHYLGKTPAEVAALKSARKNAPPPGEMCGCEEDFESSMDHEAIMQTGRDISLEQQCSGPDGSPLHLHLMKSPVFGPDGGVIGSQGILLDISERKQAEQELEKAHRQLMDASRQAGMAEVATSVLHNVGNVLNSVNVSSTVALEKIRKSKINSLGRLGALIREHQADAAAFFSTDPRGTQLPGYLIDLSEHLVSEQKELLTEIELTRKNIEHIKEIVMMQQNYAKVSGVVEKVTVIDLIEDALRMNSGALVRHDVQVIRDFSEPAPEITVDRHKVLQVLVNLIRNAKYACGETGGENKRMTLQLRNAGGRVRIAVIDNGVGIPAANMTRIFNHGFTTRKEGHGFGLHSGALAAKELGGELTAESAGAGAGATFTLVLPLQPPQDL